MNISKYKPRAIVSLMLPTFLTLMACGTYLLAPPSAGETPVAVVTETPAHTLVPTPIPFTPTPDLEMTETAAFFATSQAIEQAVSTQGAKLYSVDWNNRVDATLQALGMIDPTPTLQGLPPTPVLFPFPVTTTEVSVDGGKRTVIEYTLVDQTILQAAREPMQRYLDFIRFREGFPGDAVAGQLAEYLDQDQFDLGPGSCIYSKMLSGIQQLQWKGFYLRLTPVGEMIFEDYWLHRLTADSDIELAQRWHVNGMKIEKVSIKTGEVTQTESYSHWGGDLSVRYNLNSHQWILFDDNSNAYCHSLFIFS